MVMRFPQLPLPAANCSFSEVWYTILHATIYVFSTRELSATLLQTSGEIPSPHVGHAGALISSVLFIWGGDTNTGGQEVPTEPQGDSLYLLNLGTSDL
jgi:acid phosphatase family membrane protein YuiD